MVCAMSEIPTSAGHWIPNIPVPGVPAHVQEAGAFLPRVPMRLPVLENSTHRLLTEAAVDVVRLDEAAASLTNVHPLTISTLCHEGQSSLGGIGVFASIQELLRAEMAG